MSRLRELLVDLGRNAKLHDAYVTDPKAVMRDYALTTEEVAAMLAKDLDAVKRLSGMDNLKTNSTIRAYDE
jgi:hypothetical protein